MLTPLNLFHHSIDYFKTNLKRNMIEIQSQSGVETKKILILFANLQINIRHLGFFHKNQPINNNNLMNLSLTIKIDHSFKDS